MIGPDVLFIKVTAEVIRINVKNAHKLLIVGNPKDSLMTDFLNHIDTLAQMIEREIQ